MLASFSLFLYLSWIWKGMLIVKYFSHMQNEVGVQFLRWLNLDYLDGLEKFFPLLVHRRGILYGILKIILIEMYAIRCFTWIKTYWLWIPNRNEHQIVIPKTLVCFQIQIVLGRFVSCNVYHIIVSLSLGFLVSTKNFLSY